MEDRLSEIEAKSREEVSNPTGLRHSRGPNCESVCAGMFIHMFLQASLTVCVSESLLLCLPVRCGILGCVCMCVSWAETEEESECGVLCLCVLASVCRFDSGVKPPRANGDTAVTIYLKHLSGILRVVREEEE